MTAPVIMKRTNAPFTVELRAVRGHRHHMVIDTRTGKGEVYGLSEQEAHNIANYLNKHTNGKSAGKGTS